MINNNEVRFENLGISFPLFKAPVEECPNYLGIQQCVLCNTPNSHCFNIDEILLECPKCHTETLFH